jgi:hypothetical protein
MMRVSALLVTLLTLAGCTGDDPGEIPAPPAGDVATYARDLQPLLEASCATLDCHGDRARPLRLYAETGLRATDALRDQPLTMVELAANASALLAVDPGAAPDDHLAVRKPLPPAEGGVAHIGGKLWRNRQEPAFLCVRSWLAGASDPVQCAAAYAKVRLPAPVP